MLGELEELKERIAASMDFDQFFDLLGLELADVIDLFGEEIEDAKPRFVRALR